jgi:DNA-binding transcriptional MerR regulator
MSFTIRELEVLSGIKAHTIRIWEQRYHFLKPSRTPTNIRTYSNEELKTLLNVALLNKHGYKISAIDKMQAEHRAKAVLELDSPGINEHLVNEMIGYMIDMRPVEFEKLLNDHIKKHGIEKTITELIFGFLEKVGLLWQTNRVVPIQEHIVSNIIRQKIISAINDLPFVKKEDPLFILFLPEDEHHEMGLLFVSYLLRKKKIPVIYLGANVPLKDVSKLIELKAPEYLYLHLTSFPHQHNFQKFIAKLSQQAGKSKVLISGSIVQGQRKPTQPGISLFQSFGELTSCLETISV